MHRTSPPPPALESGRTYSATVRTDGGSFRIDLDPASAPVTVNNFVVLAREGFYNGLTFHRRVEGFVLQGGDPAGNGTGGPPYKLPDETTAEGRRPETWRRGSVAMASSAAGVSGSQFFVLLGDAPHLAGSGVYNHFGRVTGGLDVVDGLRQGARIDGVDIVEA